MPGGIESHAKSADDEAENNGKDYKDAFSWHIAMAKTSNFDETELFGLPGLH